MPILSLPTLSWGGDGATFVAGLVVLSALATVVRNEFRRVPSERLFWVGTALFFAALVVAAW
jgi:hypothetical protein